MHNEKFRLKVSILVSVSVSAILGLDRYQHLQSHAYHMMNPDEFHDPLSFPVVPNQILK